MIGCNSDDSTAADAGVRVDEAGSTTAKGEPTQPHRDHDAGPPKPNHPSDYTRDEHSPADAAPESDDKPTSVHHHDEDAGHTAVPSKADAGEPDDHENGDDSDDDDETSASCGGANDPQLVVHIADDGTISVTCGNEVVLVVDPQPTTGSNNGGGNDHGGGNSGGGNHNDVDAGSDETSGGNGGTGGDGDSHSGLCTALHALEKFPARSTIVSSSATSPTPQPVFVADVYDRFRSGCGACHVDTGLGGFKVSPNTFTQLVTKEVIERIKDPDILQVMPPGTAYSSRGANDPILELYDLLMQWRNAIEPLLQADPTTVPTVYFPPSSGTSSDGTSPYLLSPELGAAMTNLGTCLPDAALVNTETTESLALDTKFAQATELPKTLKETDLTTLDSSELARRGVISYAPTYPLFSDDAGKMRYVRVPRGTAIVFDKATQEFTIPPNTRIYKTFLKKVKDANGNADRWRKIETRLIVSRPDNVMQDGTRQPTALFGTYQWDEAETEATLVEDPLRNGQPFRDRLFRYMTDEVEGPKLIADDIPDLDRELANRGAARYYGIPGSERCIGCHRGSSNHSFLLGFTPLQVNRLPMDDGSAPPAGSDTKHLHGIITPPSDDELTQLQRLVDYGVITGIDDPADPQEVFPLEVVEDEPPRNDYELIAQGYMVGNCGICHNPDGLASYENPVLKDILNFWPSQNGGVFGFPMKGDNAFSPRIFGGPSGDNPLPYISPELHQDSKQHNGGDMLAPWHSLIYRNVDTPFTYLDQLTLFPHMPLNVPGYDKRVRNIMGDWMTSIPARELATPVGEQTYEEVPPGASDYDAAKADADARLDSYHHGGRFDCVDFVECEKTLCDNPCVDTRDIVAHEVLDTIRDNSPTGPLTPEPVPNQFLVPVRPHWVNTDLTQPALDHWEPRRPDWAQVLMCGNGKVDLGDPAITTDDEECDDGPLGSTECSISCKKVNCSADDLSDEDQKKCVPTTRTAAEALTVELLQNIKLTDQFRELALGERPMTFWEKKPKCDLKDLPTGDTYTGPGPVAWITTSKKYGKPTDLPLYFQSPGEALFSSVCANCHGPKADSTGRQATTVALMSGGETRVANLRDGLLGQGHIQAQFGNWSSAEASPTDLAARYVSWMALGGTLRRIPEPVLTMVRKTKIYGQTRVFADYGVATPNMLEQAVRLCTAWLDSGRGTTPFILDQALPGFEEKESALLVTNGDLEMWRDLCTFSNPPPVRAIGPIEQRWSTQPDPHSDSFAGFALVSSSDLDGRPLYPGPNEQPDSADPYAANKSWFGTQTGHSVHGLFADNTVPWCIMEPQVDNPEYSTEWEVNFAGFKAAWEAEHPGELMPICADQMTTAFGTTADSLVYAWNDDRRDRWARRGAINGGLAVLSYLEAVNEGLLPKPAYNRCEDR
ncbi:MAG TPA: hypothetical protein VHM70_00595 [Polyangiaceae bacterium]|nr:hypothetical protein [Polyangiaceae bacterium]